MKRWHCSLSYHMKRWLLPELSHEEMALFSELSHEEMAFVWVITWRDGFAPSYHVKRRLLSELSHEEMAFIWVITWGDGLFSELSSNEMVFFFLYHSYRTNRAFRVSFVPASNTDFHSDKNLISVQVIQLSSDRYGGTSEALMDDERRNVRSRTAVPSFRMHGIGMWWFVSGNLRTTFGIYRDRVDHFGFFVGHYKKERVPVSCSIAMSPEIESHEQSFCLCRK
jgi:hypothetical protein